MRAIGIREFKAQLSAVLREVQRGEVILVTDRGRVVAEVRQPGDDRSGESQAERGLLKLAARGEVRLATKPRRPLPPSPITRMLPEGTTQELIDWVRGED
jgi:antitoxin (DNA-binding transcriptional repressor) of toxin-antitoxin stability system